MGMRGKRVLVTGASGGIGRATALLLADMGSRLALHYFSNEEGIDSLLGEIEGKRGRHVGDGGDDMCYAVKVRADVARYEEVKAMVGSVVERFDGIDVLVAAAGYPMSRDMWFTDPLELDDDMLDRPWRVDLKGSYNCIKAVIPYMRRQGSGSIVLVSSTPAISGDVHGLAYTLAKAALIALTRSLALALAPSIRINCVALGSISTDANMRGYDEDYLNTMIRGIPMRRFGTPEEAAKTIVFLASDDASYITGQVVVVDGGEVRA
ncbi:MAG: SDR family oxidoreductase [Candidatus Nitrosocaldus sp.]|nr:SDR family oxidoreductase [Candidatus Nitrosocaldus sp.]MDW7999502.1 SDR family NAD(P)-dependent oxidoreductase [Candidatus Nitrosocaldus sp.]